MLCYVIGKGAVCAGGLMPSQILQKASLLCSLRLCAMNHIRITGEANYNSSGINGVTGLNGVDGINGSRDICTSTITSLHGMLEKELDVGIKYQIALVLGLWLQIFNSSINNNIDKSSNNGKNNDNEYEKLSILFKSMKQNLEKHSSNNPQCIAYLVILVISIRSNELVSENKSFLYYINTNYDISTICMTILKEVNKKVLALSSSFSSSTTTIIGNMNNSIEAILALEIILSLSFNSKATLSLFDSSKLWSLFTSTYSFLYNTHVFKYLTQQKSSTPTSTTTTTTNVSTTSNSTSTSTFFLHSNSSSKIITTLLKSIITIGNTEAYNISLLHSEVICSIMTSLSHALYEYKQYLHIIIPSSLNPKYRHKSSELTHNNDNDDKTNYHSIMTNNNYMNNNISLVFTSTFCRYMISSSLSVDTAEYIATKILLITTYYPSTIITFLQSLWELLLLITNNIESDHHDLLNNYKSSDDGNNTNSSCTSNSSSCSSKSLEKPSPNRIIYLLDTILNKANLLMDKSDSNSSSSSCSSSSCSSSRGDAVVDQLVTYTVAIICHPYVNNESTKKCSQLWKKTYSRFFQSIKSSSGSSSSSSSSSGGDTDDDSSVAFNYSSSHLDKIITNVVMDCAVSTSLATRKASYRIIHLLASPSSLLASSSSLVSPSSSPSATFAPATSPSLSTITSSSTTIIITHIIPQLSYELNRLILEFYQLTSHDLFVYTDKNNAIQLAINEKLASSTINTTDITITNADRKKSTPRSARRGNFGADNPVEDDDWAERVKQEKALKLQQSK
jgi:hypothetical protein